MKVVVTGANGFIGKNLCSTLELNKDITLCKYDKGNSKEELINFLSGAQYVFHLAGVNRPENIEEFDQGNRGLTEEILDIIEARQVCATFIMTSSIQADLNNPYGKSKRAAEEAILEWSERTRNKAYIYRLPNVFGKWCKPNYNSVIATFCHNIANQLPIQINDPSKELNLVYIDDVIEELQSLITTDKITGYYEIQRSFNKTLQNIAELIYHFADSRESLIIPSFNDLFSKFLYATYISYLPDKNFSYPLEMKHDQRGWLSEFIKSKELGQIFISRTKPGITRGNHWHHTKVEKFLVIEGEALICFRKIDETNVIEYRVSGEALRVLDIPTGYTHSITNIGDSDVITLFWSNEIFNADRPDTYYLGV